MLTDANPERNQITWDFRGPDGQDEAVAYRPDPIGRHAVIHYRTGCQPTIHLCPTLADARDSWKTIVTTFRFHGFARLA